MSRSQSIALLALRASLGLLMIVWGADKLANPAHGVRVAEHFYFGLLGARALMPVLGGLQIALGVAVAAGHRPTARCIPSLLAVTGLTLAGVWRSVLDPWGWYLSGTNALFFPSLIVFAGALVVWAFRDGRPTPAPAERELPPALAATSRSAGPPRDRPDAVDPIP